MRMTCSVTYLQNPTNLYSMTSNHSERKLFTGFARAALTAL